VNNDETSSSFVAAKYFQFPFREKGEGGHEKEILTLLQNQNMTNIPKPRLVVGPHLIPPPPPPPPGLSLHHIPRGNE
jgi:hypothetical protein